MPWTPHHCYGRVVDAGAYLEEADGGGREVGRVEARTGVGLHEGQNSVAHPAPVLQERALWTAHGCKSAPPPRAHTHAHTHATRRYSGNGEDVTMGSTNLFVAGEQLRELMVQVVPILDDPPTT